MTDERTEAATDYYGQRDALREQAPAGLALGKRAADVYQRRDDGAHKYAPKQKAPACSRPGLDLHQINLGRLHIRWQALPRLREAVAQADGSGPKRRQQSALSEPIVDEVKPDHRGGIERSSHQGSLAMRVHGGEEQ
jgi:hypothetical protein